MREKEEIIEIAESMAGKFAPHEILEDWFKLYALAIANSAEVVLNAIYKKREAEYETIAKQYTEEELKKFGRMTAILVDCLTRQPEDVLGYVYMLAAAKNKNAGQFFTPFNMSKAAARISVDGIDTSKEKIKIHEPSCGSGGMIVATFKELRLKGINPQKTMWVEASDIDLRCVYMAYIQMSLLGIKGVVYQKDTLTPLTEEVEADHMFITPAAKGMLI